MRIDDSRTRVSYKPIGSLPVETFVYFDNYGYGMIVSHDVNRGITTVYDFEKHILNTVIDNRCVAPFNATLVLERGTEV